MAALAAVGAELVDGEVYANNRTPVMIRCSQGHVGLSGWPIGITRGGRACRNCTERKPFDRVYLAIHTRSGAIKVGIASGPERMKSHIGRGYRLFAQWEAVSSDECKRIESMVKRHWCTKNWNPVARAPHDGHTETARRAYAAQSYQLIRMELGPAAPFNLHLI